MSFSFWAWSFASLLWFAGAIVHLFFTKSPTMAVMYLAVFAMNAFVASTYV